MLFADSRARARERKTRQLCAQVERAVSLALGACSDPVLRELHVEAVEPCPDGGRLLVVVRPWSAAGSPLHAEILERLAAANALLRAEVAAAIHRKRAPLLVFEAFHGFDEEEDEA